MENTIVPRASALQLLKHLGEDAYQPESLRKPPLVMTPGIFVEAVRQQPIANARQQLSHPVRLEKHQGQVMSYCSTLQGTTCVVAFTNPVLPGVHWLEEAPATSINTDELDLMLCTNLSCWMQPSILPKSKLDYQEMWMYNKVLLVRPSVQQPFVSNESSHSGNDTCDDAKESKEAKSFKVYLLNKQVPENKNDNVLMRDQYCFALEVALRSKVDHIVLMVPPERHQTIAMYYLCDALQNYCRVASTRKPQLHMLVDHFVNSTVYNILASGVADVNRQFFNLSSTAIATQRVALQQTHLQAILQRANVSAAATPVAGGSSSSSKKHHCSCCVAAHKRKCKKARHKKAK